MPASWDFEIYEDTPEEEAANLMEHSTQTLDLSSDDENAKAERDYRGKENEAPEGYDAPTASRPAATANELSLPAPTRVKKTEFIRRKIAEMDDGERSPLSDLETDEFIPEGLAKDAHVVVDASPEKHKLDVKSLFAVPSPLAPRESKKASKLAITSIATSEAETSESVIIWEDDAEGKEVETAEVVTDSTKGDAVEERVSSEAA